MTLNPTFARRGLFAATAIAVLAASACSSEPQTGAGPAAFTYEDARGETITLNTEPNVVVAQSSVAAALWDNGYKVAGVYGELPDPLDYQAGDIELSQMTALGSSWGDFNIEKFSALEPDLLVDMTFDKKTLWYAGEAEAAISKVAPTIGMQLTGLSVTEQIDAFRDLAKLLGSTSDISADEANFAAAATSVSDAVRENPDLVVLALSVSDDQAWFANPAQHPDLAYLAELGVTFPGITPDSSGAFEPVSLENLGKYHADVILLDARTASISNTVTNNEIWLTLPAVRAGQQYSWYPAAPYSNKAYAKIFAEYAENISGAKPA